MTLYFKNPNVWTAPEAGFLLAVLIPQNETVLTRQRHLELLGRRVDWLIEQWMEVQDWTQAETQTLLSHSADQLALNRNFPRIEGQPLRIWRQEWALALTVENEILWETLSWQGIDFPVPVETNPEEKAHLLSLLGSSEPTLEEWLMTLISRPHEDWM
jgi:hypothetical protein